MKKSVEFFNVSLRNGHLMARPKHEPKYSFVGSLLLELERKQPEFLWMQMDSFTPKELLIGEKRVDKRTPFQGTNLSSSPKARGLLPRSRLQGGYSDGTSHSFYWLRCLVSDVKIK